MDIEGTSQGDEDKSGGDEAAISGEAGGAPDLVREQQQRKSGQLPKGKQPPATPSKAPAASTKAGTPSKPSSHKASATPKKPKQAKTAAAGRAAAGPAPSKKKAKTAKGGEAKAAKGGEEKAAKGGEYELLSIAGAVRISYEDAYLAQDWLRVVWITHGVGVSAEDEKLSTTHVDARKLLGASI